MPLQTQVVSIPIAGGLGEGADYRVVEPGAWLTINNMVYDQAGALRKRNGYGALGRSVPLSVVPMPGTDKLDAFSGRVLAYGLSATDYTPHVYSYSSAIDAWPDHGQATPASVRRQQVHRGAVGVDGPHVARVDGLVMTTWYIYGLGSFWKLTDAETGAVIVEETLLSADLAYPTTFTAGGEFILIANDTVALDVRAHKFNRTTFAWSGPTTILALAGVPRYDGCPLGADSFAVVVYDAGTGAYTLSTWTVSTMVQAATVTQASPMTTGLSLQADASTIALSLAYAADVRLSCYDHALAPLSVGTLIYAGMVSVVAVAVGFTAGGDVLVLWSGFLVATETVTLMQKAGTNGVFIGAMRRQYGTILYSKPFIVGEGVEGSTYAVLYGQALLCLDDTTDTSRAFTLCGTSALQETLVSGFGGLLTLALPRPNPQAWLETGQWVIPQLVLTGPGAIPGVSNAGIDQMFIDFRAHQPGLWVSSMAQGCLVTSGGLVGWFDGQSHTELGFIQPPTIESTVVTGGAGFIEGAGLAPGDNRYVYIARYEWIDEAGNTHYSAFSQPAPVDVDLANTNAKITIKTRGLHATRKALPGSGVLRYPRIALYRTEKNATTFYRITSPAVTVLSDAMVTLPTNWSVTYEDVYSDFQMLNLEFGTVLLESQGGPLDNQWPPPSLAVCTHKNRLWSASAEDDKAVWFSKQFVRGEGPGFNYLLQVRVDDSPDGVTALASLDDKLVIFTRSRIYYVIGDGPADTGANGSFSEPILVTANAGCIDARSVVAYDEGVVFQSKGGFYVLNRALQVGYLGMPVQETLRQYNEVLSVVHDPDRSWLIWLCKLTDVDGEVFGAKSVFIVYDYLHKAWSTWTTTATDTVDGVSAQAIVDGVHVWGDAFNVALENGGTGTLGYDPDTTWIHSTLETPWFKFAGIGGFQRIRHVVITGQLESPHTITAEMSIDYGAGVVQTRSWDSTTMSGLPQEHLGMHVKYQKCATMKLKISDGAPDSPTSHAPAGFSIAGLSLEVGVKQGRDKLPAANRK